MMRCGFGLSSSVVRLRQHLGRRSILPVERYRYSYRVAYRYDTVAYGTSLVSSKYTEAKV
jgi:hypothetical protein